jgi:hypothetical protein
MELSGSVLFPEDPAILYHHVSATSGLVASLLLSHRGAQIPGVMSLGKLNFVLLRLIFLVHRWNVLCVIFWRLEFGIAPVFLKTFGPLLSDHF